MGKITRRGSTAVAVAAAATLAFAPSALADGSGPDNSFRFSGEDRIGTSIDAAKRSYSLWDETVIIANSREFADALAAAPLADTLNAPVILDKAGDAPSPQVEAYGKWLDSEHHGDVSRVILASGDGVFSDDYITAVEAEFGITPERVSGADRYGTAVALSTAAIEAQDGLGDGNVNVYLADGTNFPDGLSAGAAAAGNDGVVLLTKGSTGIGEVTATALEDNESVVNSIFAVGAPAADAAAAGDSPVVLEEAYVGSDRYETATMVADEYFGETTSSFVLTSGENYPDAVAGAAYAANSSGPLLLTRKANLTDTTRDYLLENSPWTNGYTFGGAAAVSENVTDQLADLDLGN